MSDVIINGKLRIGVDSLSAKKLDGTEVLYTEGERPAGTINLNTNGTHDVTNYVSANVNVPAPDPVLQEKTATENGEVVADAGYDGLRKVTVDTDLIDVDALPTVNVDENKVYRARTRQYYVAYNDTDSGFTITTANEALNKIMGALVGATVIIHQTEVDSIDDVTNPMITEDPTAYGTMNLYLYIDTSTYIGYYWTDAESRETLASILSYSLNVTLEDKGLTDSFSEITESGLYYVIEPVKIGSSNKEYYNYNGLAWKLASIEDVESLPTNYVRDDKIYRESSSESVQLYMSSYGEVNSMPSEMVTVVSSIDSVTDPIISGETGGHIYVDTSTYTSYVWVDATTRMTFVEFMSSSGLILKEKGTITSVEQITEDGIYYLVQPIKIGIPNSRRDKQILQYTGEEWVSSEPVLQEKTVTENGTYNASDDGVDGYSTITVNVPTTGGGSTEDSGGQYLVQVIDYDGTVLKKDHLDKGAVFTLPDAPTNHKRLVFQEWSSPVDITDNTVTVGNSDITIGAVYTTKSGLSEFDITLTKFTGLSVGLNMNGTKDWGDGTSDTLTTHNYADYGNYTITCDGTEMTTTSSIGLFGQPSYGNNRNYYVVDARFANVTSIGQYAFFNCCSLTSITIPQGVTSIGRSAFYNCCSLTSITIPQGVTSIGDSAFYNCYSLISIIIPQGVTSIGTYMFAYGYLTSIIIPQGVTNIGNSAFYNCSILKKYDMTALTAVPTLSNTSVFTSINSICKIYVPDALYDEWIVATNWSSYQDYIYKASEMED